MNNENLNNLEQSNPSTLNNQLLNNTESVVENTQVNEPILEQTMIFDPIESNNNEPNTEIEPKKKNKIGIIAVILVLLILIGIGVYLFLNDKNKTNADPLVMLTTKEINLANNQTIDLKDYIVLENVKYDELEIEVKDENSLVTVDGSKITSKRTTGVLEINVKYDEFNLTLKINIDVQKSLAFKTEKITLEQNSSFNLNDYLDLVNISFDEVEVTLSDDNLANKVHNKIFTGNKNGEFTINAKYNDLEASFKVVIKTKTDIDIVNDAIENMLNISYGYHEQDYNNYFIVDRPNNRIVTTNTDCNDILKSLATASDSILEGSGYLKTKIEKNEISNLGINDFSEIYKFLYNNIKTIEKVSDGEYKLTVKENKKINNLVNYTDDAVITYVALSIGENRINSMEVRYVQNEYSYYNKVIEYFYDIPSNTDIYANNAIKCVNNYNSFMEKQVKSRNITLNGKQHELKVQYNIDLGFRVGVDTVLFANVYLDNKLISSNASMTELRINGQRGVALNFNSIPTYDITQAYFSYNPINTILEQNQILKSLDGKEYLVQHMYSAGVSCSGESKMAIIDENGNTLTTLLTDNYVFTHSQPLYHIYDNYITYTDIITTENPFRIVAANEYKLTINNGQLIKEYITSHLYDGTIGIMEYC